MVHRVAGGMQFAAVAEVPVGRLYLPRVVERGGEFDGGVVACHVLPVELCRDGHVAAAGCGLTVNPASLALAFILLRRDFLSLLCQAVGSYDYIVVGVHSAEFTLQLHVERLRPFKFVDRQGYAVLEMRPLHRGAQLPHRLDAPLVEHPLAALVRHGGAVEHQQRAGTHGGVVRYLQLLRLQHLDAVYIVVR